MAPQPGVSPARQRRGRGPRSPSDVGRAMTESQQSHGRPACRWKIPLESGRNRLFNVLFLPPPPPPAAAKGAANWKAILAGDWKEKGNFSWPRGLGFLCFWCRGCLLSDHCWAVVLGSGQGPRPVTSPSQVAGTSQVCDKAPLFTQEERPVMKEKAPGPQRRPSRVCGKCRRH